MLISIRPRALLASVIALICLSVSSLASDWSRGVDLYKKGDFQRALAEFQDIVAERPEAAGAWYYIGLCQFKLSKYDRVEVPLSHAIDLLEVQSPASADILGAWYTIGFSRYLSGAYERALEPLNKYLELASKSGHAEPSAKQALGRSYFFLERYDEALPFLSTDPDETAKEGAPYCFYAGSIYFKKGDDDNAIRALKNALKSKPDDASTLNMLAESLMRKARSSGAADMWSEAAYIAENLHAARDDARTDSVLGRAYLGAGQFEKAVPPLEKIAKANTQDGQAWLLYGIALSRSGMRRKAMEALEITIQLVPESIPALSELAYVYESDKQYQQALRIYEKAYAVTGSKDPNIKQSMERVRVLAEQKQ